MELLAHRVTSGCVHPGVLRGQAFRHGDIVRIHEGDVGSAARQQSGIACIADSQVDRQSNHLDAVILIALHNGSHRSRCAIHDDQQFKFLEGLGKNGLQRFSQKRFPVSDGKNHGYFGIHGSGSGKVCRAAMQG